MKVLITGCLGYIGSLLTAHFLALGHTVIGVDNLLFNNKEPLLSLLGYPNFTFKKDSAVYADDYIKRYRPDLIIPLAAYVGAPLCDKYPKNAAIVNTTQISKIVDCLSNGQRIIFPNTNSGYGIKQGICTELDPLSPISHYGRTKCEAENIVLEHQNSAVLRLATVFGASPRMRFDLMVNDFVAQMVYDRQITVFEGQFRRNFVHVRDVCRAFLHCIDPSISGIYNIGDDAANCTKLQLAQRIQMWLGGEVFEGKGNDPDKRDYNVSSSKIKQTGFEFKHSLEQGVFEVAEICKIFSKSIVETSRNTNV